MMDKTTCDKITYYILLATAVLMIGMFVALAAGQLLFAPPAGPQWLLDGYPGVPASSGIYMLLAALTGLVGGVFVFLTDYDGPPEGGSDGERDVFDALSCSHGAVGGVGLRQPVSGYLRPLETRGPGKAQAPPQRHLQQISPSRRCDQLFDRACPFLYPTLALSVVTQSPEHTAPGFAVCAYPTRSKTSSSRMVRSSKRLRRSSAASAARRLKSHSGLPASTSR